MPIFIDVFHEFYGTAIVPTFIDIVPFLINIVPTYNLFLFSILCSAFAQNHSQDHWLRKFIGVKQVRDGGPSPEQLRKDLEAQGKNYELTLDFANRAHGVATRY